MKNRLVKRIVSQAASFFTSIALSVTASACLWDYYQPEVPEALKEE